MNKDEIPYNDPTYAYPYEVNNVDRIKRQKNYIISNLKREIEELKMLCKLTEEDIKIILDILNKES